ncbi:MAG: peptidoglycan DD-metalloendopeptidase family protein [Bacteroidota bacterium]
MRIFLPFTALSLLIGSFATPVFANNIATDTLTPIATNTTGDRALKLLTTDPIFTENWINDVTFTYDNVRTVDLPEVTTILISQASEKFTPTWYGKLSSAYKWRWGRQHHGVDLGLKTGEPIYAAWDGVVRYAQWNNGGYGNCVVIRHKNGLETLYGHMSKLLVSPNQYVTSGDIIGLGGSTGHSSGPHLHFEIRYKDFSINPELIIDYDTRTLRLDTFQFVRANIKGTRYSGDINAAPSTVEPELVKTTEPVKSDSIKTATPTAPITEQPKPITTVTPVTSTAKAGNESKTKVVPPVKSNSKKTPPTAKKELAKKKTPPTKKLPTTYTIKPGDTFTSIAKRTGVSIANLKKLNPKQKETLLMPGKNIRIR